MVSSFQSIKERIMFWKELWPTKFMIYRNRGDTYAPDIVPAARIKYTDRHNAHKMRTGEKIPAVPLRYVMTGDDGTPWIHAVEADDDQLVIFKPDFNMEEGANPLESQKIDLDTDMEGEEIKQAFEDKDYNVVSFSVLENIDQRKTFLAEEIKTSETKYRPSSLFYEYPQLALVMATSLAVVIILYATSANYGEFVPVLKELSGNMNVLEQASQNLGSAAPPGN